MVDVYKVGVSLVANHSGIMSALAAVAGRMTAIQGQAASINSVFGNWGKTLGVVGGVLATVGITKGLEAIAKAGAAVNHQLNLMEQAGMNSADIASAQMQAKLTASRVLTTSYAENLKHIRELRYAFGNSDIAMQHLDEVAKANSVLNAVRGGAGHDEVWELVKALEGKGLTYKPDEFNSYVNTMTKVVQATGGKVTPQMFMSTFKYGRTATLGWDEAFVSGALPRLIQSMASAGGGGGSGNGGPGNALMSAFAKVVQGQMPKTAAEEFQRMGLGTANHIKGSAESQIEGGIKGRDLFIKDPYEWVQQILMPALKAHGITSDNDIMAEISRMFPVRTASQIITEMGLQGRFHEGTQSPFEKDIALQKGALGVAGYDKLITQDYDTIMNALSAQFKHLKEVLGDPLMAPGGPVISALASITSGLGQIAKFAGDHPGAVKIALEAVAGFLAALATAGLVALAAALGPLVGTTGLILSLVGALTALAAFNWASLTSSIKGFLSSIEDWVKSAPKGKEASPNGPSDDMFKYTPMRFNPGIDRAPRLQPVSFSLNVDGRQLTSAIVQIQEAASGFPTDAGSDGLRLYNGSGV